MYLTLISDNKTWVKYYVTSWYLATDIEPPNECLQLQIMSISTRHGDQSGRSFKRSREQWYLDLFWGEISNSKFPFPVFHSQSRLILSNLNRDTSRSKRTSIPFSESSDSLCGALMLWLYHYLALQVCRNNCSGHGYCDRSTKMCVCESFWMQDFFKVHFGTRESNCGRWLVALLFFCLFVCLFFPFQEPR